jgi:hypothetical protein
MWVGAVGGASQQRESENLICSSSIMEIAGHNHSYRDYNSALATRNSYLSTTELMASQDFSGRPINKLVLFDVDGTLTPARQVYLFPVLPSRALIGHKGSVT